MSGFGQSGFGQSPFGGSPSFPFPNNSRTNNPNGGAVPFPGTPGLPTNANWNSNNVPHTPVPFAQNQQQSNHHSTPFGSSAAAPQPMVFGSAQSTAAIAMATRSNPAANPFAPASSHNPFAGLNGPSVMTTPAPAFGAASPPGVSGFGAPMASAAPAGMSTANNSNPFGGPSSGAPPIAGNPFASNIAAATPSVSFDPSTSAQHNPFGGVVDSSSAPNSFATSSAPSNPFAPANSNTQWVNNPSFPPNPTNSQNDRKTRRKTPFGPPGSSATDDSDDGMMDGDDVMPGPAATNNDHAEKLAMLKAKLEKKKRNLQAKNQQKQAATGLNPQAAAFQPQAAEPKDTSSTNDNPFTRYKGNDSNTSDAPTRKHLPADLLQQANHPTASSTSSAITNIAKPRETLENASSLVGICQTMCPDEEILRRERESDVQLLERVDHTIHPNDWTLRDTMVKRFRRSAADFKLDVPEWVRPPDVLERVCSYLEEWIMERDRQGPDPRYEHNQNKTPLPLDVYQFIWDRTRMVRKDFTLQNYVGGKTGHCDARAVRCHERMARWHCLCEHQLSHIPEFQSQQSQQNLQELGQTLKSLNQYYDDTMCRSLVEEADANGHELRNNATRHGCQETAIQGSQPVDYDGTPLKPKASEKECFVGVSASPSHGTAEPEMRGLYILQTMMNEADGGLEITRFAFNLLQNRPEIYNSAPVQLALTIFKTKNANNYAKFFAILRSSSTPYLFSCLMFKMVPQMRREAIKSMARTYGGQKRDGTLVGDSYSLKRLVRLLCYEDTEEALAALKHFNIKTGQAQGQYGISWKGSSFKDPIDPTKGTKLQLFAKKMVNTIERRLDGASRLAICRGQVSGVGATLSPEQVSSLRQRTRGVRDVPTTSLVPAINSTVREQLAANVSRERERTAKLELKKREVLQQKLEEEQLARDRSAKERLEEERMKQNQLEEERKKRAVEEEKHAEFQRNEEEKERRLEALKRKEARDREKREQQKLRKEDAAKRAAEERKRAEEARALELERQRLFQEKEQKRKELEEEERRRQVEIRAENERKRKIKEARDAAYRQKCLEAARKRHQIEHEVSSAKKKLAWAILRSKTQHILPFPSAQYPTTKQNDAPMLLGCHPFLRELELLKSKTTAQCFASSSSSVMAAFGEKLSSNERHWRSLRQPFEKQGERTFLLKLAIVLPYGRNVYATSLAKSWICARLDFEESVQNSSTRFCFVFNNGNKVKCDGAIVVLPPVATQSRDVPDHLERMIKILPPGVPKMVLALLTEKEIEAQGLVGMLKRETHSCVACTDYSINAFDAALQKSLSNLATEMKNYPPFEVERLPSSRFFYECARRAIWLEEALNVREDICFVIEREVRRAIESVEASWSGQENWPDNALLRNVESRTDNAHGDLPLGWAERSNRLSIEPSLMSLLIVLRASSLPQSIELLIDDAPARMKSSCLQLLEQRQFRSALELALAWQSKRIEGDESVKYIYAPVGTFEDILDQIQSFKEQDRELRPTLAFNSSLSELPTVEASQQQSTGSSDCEIVTTPSQVALSSRKSKRSERTGKSLNRPNKVSKTVAQSRLFTERLETLAAGDTVNMPLGDSSDNLTTLRASLIGTSFGKN